jgi:hypothetical protein
VRKPKTKGGLGVIDLQKQNKALLMKNLHKLFNAQEVPLVSMVWEKLYSNGKLPSAKMKGEF